MTFIRGANGANQPGLRICQKPNRVGIERNLRPVFFAVAGYAFEQFLAFLRWIDADTEDLNFSFEVALPLVDKGRHLGPAPGSPTAAIKKYNGRRSLREGRWKFDRRPVDVLEFGGRKFVAAF